jgi:hypothetical protein
MSYKHSHIHSQCRSWGNSLLYVLTPEAYIRNPSELETSYKHFSEQDLRFSLWGYNAVESTQRKPTFWRNMCLPSSESKNKPSEELAWNNNVAIATCATKTLVDFQWSTWPYIPKERTLHSQWSCTKICLKFKNGFEQAMVITCW